MKKLVMTLLAFSTLSSFAQKATTLKIDLDGDSILDTVQKLPLNEKNDRLMITLSKTNSSFIYDNLLEKQDSSHYCGEVHGSLLSKKMSGNNKSSLLITMAKGNRDGCETGYEISERSFEIIVSDGELVLSAYMSSLEEHYHHNSHYEDSLAVDFLEGSFVEKEFRGYYQGVKQEIKTTFPPDWCQVTLKDFNDHGLPSCVTSPFKNM